MARSLALLALASAAMAAQSTTVSLLLPYGDAQALVASVIAADSTATTYLFGCAPGTDSDDCGYPSSETVTQGPSTWIYTASYTGDDGENAIQGGHCKLNTKANAADCTMWATMTVTGSVSSTTAATTMTFLEAQNDVTVTAGLDKLQATPGASVTDDSTSAPTNTGASETAKTTASTGAAQTTLAKQTTGTSTVSSTAKPTSTNAAGAVNAQNGLLAGVAAIVGGAMML
ncbi:hypothetical protein ACHAQJ_006232 [Trichoderma viride]